MWKYFRKLNDAAELALAKTIVLFLVVVLIFVALFPTIAQQLKVMAANTTVAAIPGATVIIPIVSLLGIIILLMFAIKKAF